jgi:hypothetical protein
MQEVCNQEEKHCGFGGILEVIVQKYMNLCKHLKHKADKGLRPVDISLAAGVRGRW